MVDVVSVIVSISNDFSLNSKGNVLFHCTAFCHLRDVPCEDTFTMGVSAATSDWVPIGTDAYVTYIELMS